MIFGFFKNPSRNFVYNVHPLITRIRSDDVLCGDRNLYQTSVRITRDTLTRFTHIIRVILL